MQNLIPILILTMALILSWNSTRLITHHLPQILGRVLKCRLYGPKQTVAFWHYGNQVFEGKVEFKREIVANSFVPKNKKPKRISKHAVKFKVPEIP